MSELCKAIAGATEDASLSEKEWWAGLDSNQRRRKPADLQSAPFGHFGTYPRRGKNERLI